MLKFRLAPLAVLGLCTALAFAQTDAPKVTTNAPEEAAASQPPAAVKRRVKRAAATPMPVATPIPDKKGFWSRVFSKKKGEPGAEETTPKPDSKAAATKAGKTSTPAKGKAIPTPAEPPTPPKSIARKPVTKKTETAKVEEPKTEEVKAETSAPPAEKTEVVAKTTPAPKKGSKSSKAKTETTTTADSPGPDGSDPEALEKWKYGEAKTKAMGEEKLQAMRARADEAPSEEEARKALRTYNKALFDRMRDIDPSIKDYINGMESAVLRRLGE